MRILFLNSAPIITHGMARGFMELGHSVEYVVPGDQKLERMLQRVEQFKPDLLFTEGGVGREESIAALIDQTSLPHVYWAIEDPIAPQMSLHYAKRSVLTLTTYEEFIEQVYQPAGVRSLCIPFACSPQYHRTGAAVPELAHELVFFGNNYDVHQNRKVGYDSMFRPALRNGWDIAFYGDENWVNGKISFVVPPHAYKGYLSYDKMPDMCASAKFILGVHSINGSRTMQAMRTFEVLGCGGFFFTQHTTAIEAMFQNHVHLVWSQSPEQTEELYTYYRNRPEEMDKIRRQGQQFVYDNHTYKHRAAEILHHLQGIV
ncbi:glycosyltransferase [Paenibacillus sp. YYML68]|uniref:CgeB family protein n=1 Tax=Paenibacillus sp. YYML68 TaxID=2909250 RepID=UPI0024907326|nr:glycosyltransferase [Paenibacillus sp. YYML68]